MMLLQNIICKIDRFTFAKRQFTVVKFEWQAVNSQNNIKLECTVHEGYRFSLPLKR